MSCRWLAGDEAKRCGCARLIEHRSRKKRARTLGHGQQAMSDAGLDFTPPNNPPQSTHQTERHTQMPKRSSRRLHGSICGRSAAAALLVVAAATAAATIAVTATTATATSSSPSGGSGGRPRAAWIAPRPALPRSARPCPCPSSAVAWRSGGAWCHRRSAPAESSVRDTRVRQCLNQPTASTIDRPHTPCAGALNRIEPSGRKSTALAAGQHRGSSGTQRGKRR